MFCPHCGQQQMSSEIRFCSRCGLPLNLVSEIVAHGGTLPQIEHLNNTKSLWNRSSGLKFGLIWFLVLTFLLTPIFAVFDIDELAALSAILGFVGGILIMVVSLMFLDKKPKITTNDAAGNFADRSNANHLRGGNAGANALPPQQSYPVSDYVQPQAGSWRANTEDLQPSSVTESTTKLLNEEDLRK